MTSPVKWGVDASQLLLHLSIASRLGRLLTVSWSIFGFVVGPVDALTAVSYTPARVALTETSVVRLRDRGVRRLFRVAAIRG
jgi:hypothetical protein